MSVSNSVFSVKGAIDKNGKLECKQTLKSIVLDIVKKLGCHSPRDFSDVNLASITELKDPKLEGNKVTLFFRIGIVFCEIKAYFDKEELLFSNTKFGVDR